MTGEQKKIIKSFRSDEQLKELLKLDTTTMDQALKILEISSIRNLNNRLKDIFDILESRL